MACRILVTGPWRLITTALLLVSCGLSTVAVPSPQSDEQDTTRRIWNKRFREARARTRTRRPSRARVKEELFGVTIWRLQMGTEKDDPDEPTAERAMADTPFSEGERLRLSIEVPREDDGYLYVIDSEVYADGTVGDPYLIFPSKTTPPGGNVVGAGKPVFVPAQGDPMPYFTLHRSRKDQVRERITMIVSPRPLKLSLGNAANPAKLPRAQVALWEKQWGGHSERRLEGDAAGRQATVAEMRAGEGERRLVQGDPLPQTMYLVKVKPGAPAMLHVPLHIAP